MVYNHLCKWFNRDVLFTAASTNHFVKATVVALPLKIPFLKVVGGTGLYKSPICKDEKATVAGHPLSRGILAASNVNFFCSSVFQVWRRQREVQHEAQLSMLYEHIGS